MEDKLFIYVPLIEMISRGRLLKMRPFGWLERKTLASSYSNLSYPCRLEQNKNQSLVNKRKKTGKRVLVRKQNI